jgi:hypothetical protein
LVLREFVFSHPAILSRYKKHLISKNNRLCRKLLVLGLKKGALLIMKRFKLLFLITTLIFSSFTFIAEGGISASKPIPTKDSTPKKAEKNNPTAAATAEEAPNPEATDETTVSGGGVAPSSGEEDTCPLCIEKPKKPAMVSPCGHIFCLECLEVVDKTFKQCPRCRGELRKIIRIPVQQGGKAASTLPVVHITPELYLAHQKEAMRALYNLLPDGAKVGALASLNNHPTNPSKWVGVKEVSEEGFIQRLDLSTNQLTGAIPPKLGQLNQLTVLDLSYNKLTGEIPSELGLLRELKYLYLHRNKLTGPIPGELGQLNQLQRLSLSCNKLTGAIPPKLGQLTKLQVLWLSSNQLTGEIPRELGQLTELQYLYLHRNQLTGPIPSELGLLTKLKTLSLCWNQLAGAIPRELGLLTELQYLYLYTNQLTGPTPPELIRRGVTVYR